MFFLRTFGGLSLELDGEPYRPLVGNRKALSVLAVLAADTSVSRDRLLGLFWADSDGVRARGSLKQTLHLLRRNVEAVEMVTGAAELQLNATVITSDVARFREDYAAGQFEAAVQHYRGPFLDGVYVSNAPDFEHWLDRRRDDLRMDCGLALDELAEAAERRSDYAAAVHWWRKRQAIDPVNGVVAARLIRALDAAGDRASALRHSEQYEAFLRNELDLPPDPTVRALAIELHSAPPPASAATLTRLAAQVPGLIERRDAAVHSNTRYRRLAKLAGATVIALLLLSGGVVAALNVTRTTSPTPATPQTNSSQAYAYLLEGGKLLQQKTVQSTNDAKRYIEHAIALDPKLTEAYVALGEVELAPGLTDPDPRLVRARRAAHQALALDSTSVRAHTLMLWVKTLYDRDYEGAEQHFRRGVELDPAYGSLYNAYSAHLMIRGRLDESLRVMMRAYEMRPNATANLVFVGMRYLPLRNFAAAEQWVDAALQRDTSFFMSHWARGRLLVERGQFDEALREFSRPGTDLFGIHQEALIGYTQARSGDTAAARATLAGLLEKRKSGGYVAPSDVAIIYIGLREDEKALDWLEMLVQHHSRVFLKAEPIFDPVRHTARFQKLLHDLGLADD